MNNYNTSNFLPPHKLGLVGGTFDYFHLGHKSLFASAFETSENIQIWLSSDEMVTAKGIPPTSWQSRVDVIKENLMAYQGRFTFHKLVDEFGCSRTTTECSAIYCTPETKVTCNEINLIRVSSGLTPLVIIEVPHYRGENGLILSSTRIRTGECDLEGNIWISEQEINTGRRITSDMDTILKKPRGEIIEGPPTSPLVAMKSCLEVLGGVRPLISVGDVCLRALLDLDEIPDLALVDGHTRRNDLMPVDASMRSHFSNILRARNSPGEVSASLFHAVSDSLTLEGSTLIEVDGEEDLAPFAILLSYPLGGSIVYGQPNHGVVLRSIDLASKSDARELWQLMEPLE